MRGLVLLGWVGLFAFLLWPVLKWMLRQRTHAFGAGTRAPQPRALHDELVKDPVCQTYVVRSRAVSKSVGGSTQYFCSPECAARFVGEGQR
jgi:YHS domain-containing protein